MVTNKYFLIGAAVAGLALAFMIKRTAGAAVEVVGDVAHAVNPFNNDNIINQGFESIYQGVTGSAGSPGTDFYDATHGGSLDITSENNFINQIFEGTYQTVTGSKGSVGGDIYDGVQAVQDWWKNL